MRCDLALSSAVRELSPSRKGRQVYRHGLARRCGSLDGGVGEQTALGQAL